MSLVLSKVPLGPISSWTPSTATEHQLFMQRFRDNANYLVSDSHGVGQQSPQDVQDHFREFHQSLQKLTLGSPSHRHQRFPYMH